MIDLEDVRVHLAPADPDGSRTVLVVARGRAGQPDVEVGLSVELWSPQERLVATLELAAQPLSEHPTLLEWAVDQPLPLPIAQCRWVAHARRVWVAPRGRLSLREVVARAPEEAIQRVVAPRRSRSAGTELPAAPSAPPPPPVDRFSQAVQRPWAEVADLFPSDSLGIDGRDRVRAMLKSDAPEEVVAACRISIATTWRTTVQPMRRLLDHPHPEVRAAAAAGIGALAGPAMEHLLRKKVETDPDPAVRDAAAAGIDAIAARSRR